MSEVQDLRQTQKWLEGRKKELTEERKRLTAELSRLQGEGYRKELYREVLMGRAEADALDSWREHIRGIEARIYDVDQLMVAADAEREANAERIHDLKDKPQEHGSPERRKVDELKAEIRRRLEANDGQARGQDFRSLPDHLLRAANGCGAQDEAREFLRGHGWAV